MNNVNSSNFLPQFLCIWRSEVYDADIFYWMFLTFFFVSSSVSGGQKLPKWFKPGKWSPFRSTDFCTWIYKLVQNLNFFSWDWEAKRMISRDQSQSKPQAIWKCWCHPHPQLAMIISSWLMECFVPVSLLSFVLLCIHLEGDCEVAVDALGLAWNGTWGKSMWNFWAGKYNNCLILCCVKLWWHNHLMHGFRHKIVSRARMRSKVHPAPLIDRLWKWGMIVLARVVCITTTCSTFNHPPIHECNCARFWHLESAEF